MYGLYRAWFGGAASGSDYPCLQDTFSPPDTVVRVGNEGEHQFVAHKGVLAAHSGYLKALLASAAAATATTTSTTTAITSSSSGGSDGGGGGDGGGGSSPFDPTCATVAAVTIGQSQRSQPVTSVSVSSVGGEAFAPLLNYMYTGRLEVTLDNVYSVLLATHLLHMPGALEQCRAALLRLRAPPPLPTQMPSSVPTSVQTSSSATTSVVPPPHPPPGTGCILRPIPSRLLVGPPLCWPPTAPLYHPSTGPAPPSVAMPHLPQMPPTVLMQQPIAHPSGIGVIAPNVRDKREQCAHYSVGEMSKSPRSSPTHHKRPRLGSRSRTPEIVSTVTLPFVAAAAAAFTAFAVTSGAANSTTRASSSPSRSISPASSSVSRSPTLAHANRRSSSQSTTTATTTTTTAIATIAEARREREIDIVGSRNDQRRKSCSVSSADDVAQSTSRGNDSVSGNNSGGDTASEHDRHRGSRRRTRSGASSAKDTTVNAATSAVYSVVYDIACCDGPVRFHRVLNENYSATSYSGSVAAQPRGTPYQRGGCQPNQSEDPPNENDENGGPTARGGHHARGLSGAGLCNNESGSDNNGANNGGNNCYTCGYCKHTFKSQYCYRKHAKRHLLPTRINETANGGGGGSGGGGGGDGGGGGGAGDGDGSGAGSGAGSGDANGPRQQQEAGRGGNRREVRLLDLNVQYYPCKICGCKFPSYYFVHKHRKLCHANDEERQGATADASVDDASVMPGRDAEAP